MTEENNKKNFEEDLRDLVKKKPKNIENKLRELKEEAPEPFNNFLGRKINESFDVAVESAKKINGEFLKSNVLYEIILVQKKAGVYDKARQTLDLMIQSAQQIEPGWTREKIYSHIASAQAMLGDYKEAKRTAEKISADDWQSVAYSKIGLSQAKEGIIDEAKKSFELARWLARRISRNGKRDSLNKRISAYNELVSAQIDTGMISEAIKSVEEFKPFEVIAAIRTDIGVAEAKSGMFDEADKTAKMLGKSYYQSLVYINMAKTQIKSGDIIGAKKTISKVIHKELGVETYCELALIQSKMGMRDEAKKSIASAVRLTKKINPHFDHESKIEEAYYRIGMTEAELGFYDEAKKTAQYTDKPGTLNVINRSRLASLQAKLGMYDEARESFESALSVLRSEAKTDFMHSLTRSNHKLRPYSQILLLAAEAGLSEQVLKTVDEVEKHIETIDKSPGIFKNHPHYDKSRAYLAFGDLCHDLLIQKRAA